MGEGKVEQPHVLPCTWLIAGLGYWLPEPCGVIIALDGWCGALKGSVLPEVSRASIFF